MYHGGLVRAVLPFLGGLPPTTWDRPSIKPDVILAYAYGRNAIADRDLGKFRQAWDNCKDNKWRQYDLLDAVDFDAGKPNEALANEVICFITELSCLAIVQWEIYLCLSPAWLQANPNRVYAVWPPPDATSFDTRHVTHGMVKIMAELNLKRPAVLAHKQHAWRAYHVPRKIIGRQLHLLPQFVDSFDKHSVQWPTQDRFNWILYDTAARVHHKFTGLI